MSVEHEKTLGQIAYEANNHSGRWCLTRQDDWHAVAAAVENEVLKRRAAKREDDVAPIVVNVAYGYCTCICDGTCPLGKIGSLRCTEAELELAGIAIRRPDRKPESEPVPVPLFGVYEARMIV
jgi:hypothetical protein